jgi:hypothetical protein
MAGVNIVKKLFLMGQSGEGGEKGMSEKSQPNIDYAF